MAKEDAMSNFGLDIQSLHGYIIISKCVSKLMEKGAAL